MPGLNYTRRKQVNRRQNSEDIEDARPTQANGHDDDVSDDGQPRQAVVKKEKKGKGKQRAPEPDADDADADGDINMDEDSEDEDDRIDVANFPNQPLRKDFHLSKLKGISQDWESMRKQIDQRSAIYKDVAAAMAEAGEVDIKSSKALMKLDEGIKEFIDVGAEMMAHSQALDALHMKIARGDLIDNAREQYDAEIKERIDAYAGKTSRQKYAKDERYRDFQSSIWEVTHPDEAMPPITEFIEQEEGDVSDDDDDVEMGGVTQSFLCPLTVTNLVNPVTSRVCNHSFSRDAIKEYCKNPREAYKCPTTGCNKRFKISDCVPDAALAKRVKAHERRQRAAEEHSDAEEVID